MADNKVTIRIKAIDEASKVIENVSKRALPDLAKSAARFATGFLSVAAVEEGIRRTVNAALEAEKATSALNAALQAQGAAYALNLPHLLRQADALSRLSLADDEAIQGVQQLLVSLGNLSGQQLDRATKSVLDLSAGLGIDLQSAAEKVAKAANGNVKEFSRLGVEFSATATDAEKLDSVLGFIDQRFGGAAAAQIKTVSGSFHELNEAIGELFETLGKQGLNGRASLISTLTDSLRDLNEQANNPKGMGFWKSLGLLLAGAATAGPGGLASASTILAADTAAAAAAAEDLENGIAATVPNYHNAAEEAERLAKATETAAKAAADRLMKTSLSSGGPSPFDSATSIDSAALTKMLDAQGLANWQAKLDGIPDALSTISDQFLQIGDFIDNTTEKTITWGEYVDDVMVNVAIAGATQLADTMIDAAFGADVAWGEALKNIAKGMLKLIVQALIYRAIMTAVGGGAGAASSGSGQFMPMMAEGGIVPAYAAGGMFVPRGTDTVPAMLTPGEMVLPRNISRAILGGRAAVVPRGGAGGNTIVIQAMDSKSFDAYLRANPRALSNALSYLDARSA